MLRKKVSELSVLKSLYYMIASGISISDACSELAMRLKDRKMAEKLIIISGLMSKEGYTFSDAMEQVDMCRNYIFIIRIGEKTGNLIETLKDVISSIEEIDRVQKKVKSSLYYPVGVIIFSILVAFGLIIVLKKILEGLNFPGTEDMLAYKIGWFLVDNKIVIFAIYIAAVVFLGYVFKKNIDKIPMVKNIYANISIGQAFKMVSLGLTSGLSPSEAFSFAAHVVKGVWSDIFETFAMETRERNVYDVMEELEQYMQPESYIVLRSKIKSGDMSAGFNMIGREYMSSAIQRLDAFSPFVTMFAFLFVAMQIAVVMSPIWVIIISFMSKVTSMSGGRI
ncbi:MAG: type II secretion system F family protein [Nitrospirae bacterium]|nr:type II secretion system F family protein [Nitrospirota bacterium]